MYIPMAMKIERDVNENSSLSNCRGFTISITDRYIICYICRVVIHLGAHVHICMQTLIRDKCIEYPQQKLAVL